MRLRQVQPGVSVAAVQEATGFPLLLGEDITELPEPSATEIEMLRELSGGEGGAP
jgi:glutaconate CoA-transferase subunit B